MKRKLFALACVVVMALLVSVPTLAADANDDTQYAQGLAGFIERIFVPHDDYFIKQMSELNDHVNAKLGGVAYLYQMINNFFQALNMGDSSAVLTFSLPRNYFFDGFQGFSYNVFGAAGAYIGLLKNVFGVFICIVTAISCYHKLRTFFSE